MASPTSVAAAPAEYEKSLASRGAAMVDVVLRVLLFIGSLTAVVVMVTSKQTELVPVPFPPFGRLPSTATFTDTPAFVYFVAALSTAGLYSIITTLLSISALSKPGYSKTWALYIVAMDVVMLAIVAAASGTAGGVAYIGFRGNSHTRWVKICNIFDKFCQHAAGAILVSMFAAIVLILLLLHSVFTMYRKIPN
ncbi:CASP-like protein 1 [Heracleum sosnowskyi]|uniref:CASP-like protein n=1 Tax=Heracleum sosnowskyi TaxID=360622 RepID=A0AAD8MZJ2_9APIA|nr:CASP-like protein 1 [Heracleum sosnowskyi]